MELQIKEILAKETYELRHPFLRKGQPIESCQLEKDEDTDTIHLGAYYAYSLVGILSAIYNECSEHKTRRAVQLRAMAVHPDFRRKKIASQLIQAILSKLKEKQSVEIIWLNARVIANDLYLNNGFSPVGLPFEIEPIGTHQRFIKWINHES